MFFNLGASDSGKSGSLLLINSFNFSELFIASRSNSKYSVSELFCLILESINSERYCLLGMLYSNDRMDLNRLRRFTLWVARYGSQPQYATDWDIWQYSSTGKVDGISGNVDMDDCRKDFPSIITNGGYNGYSKGSKPEPTPAPAPQEEYYTIVKGDTLTKIARKFGTTVNQLVAWNGIKNKNLIYAGQTIRVR